MAGPLLWDPNGTGGSDGDGVWNNTDTSWWNGTADVAYISGGTANGTTAAGSNSMTVSTVNGLQIGQVVAGANIPVGTTITGISGNTVTLSNNATAASTQPYLFSAGDAVFGNGGAAGQVTVSDLQFVNTMTFNPVSSGTYVLTSGTIMVSNAIGVTITVANNTTARIDSTIANFAGSGGLRVNGGANLILGGGYRLNTNNQWLTYGTGTVTFASGTFMAYNAAGTKSDFTFWVQNAYINQGSSTVDTGNGTAFIGYNGGQLVTYTVNDDNAKFSAGSVILGRGGSNNAGLFNLKKGTANVIGTGNSILIGFDNSKGTLLIEGGVFTATNGLTVINNYNGTGAFTLEDSLQIKGGVTTLKGIQLGVDTVNTSVVTGTASLYVSGGTLNIGASGITAAATSTSVKNINLSGGTIGVADGATGWSSSLNMVLTQGAGGNVTFDAGKDISLNNRTITLQGKLTGSGGMNVGGGTVILQGANTYAGQTVVSTGAILQLAGSHTINLASLTEPMYMLGGELDLSLGSIILNFTGVTPTVGQSWSLISGDLAGLNLGSNANWLSGFTLQEGSIWANGNNYFFDTSNGTLTYGVIPEPSTYVMLGIGVLLLAVNSRHRRA
jgi:hypothetical protein